MMSAGAELPIIPKTNGETTLPRGSGSQRAHRRLGKYTVPVYAGVALLTSALWVWLIVLLVSSWG